MQLRNKYPYLVLLMASVACSIGGNTASPTAAPIETPAPVVVTNTPPATDTPASVLPAPVLFLSNDQIWRLAVDGVTLGTLTNAPEAVVDFDVSPVDGRLAYVSDNTLFVAGADGSGPTPLVTGPALAPTRDETYLNTELSRPRWSPDGTRIAYSLNGVNVIPAAGGAPIVIRQNDPVPQPPDFQPLGAKFYMPNAWSPDGGRLSMDVAFYPEGGGLSVVDSTSGGVVDLNSPDGIVCCDPSWSVDGNWIYFSSYVAGFLTPGLWRANTATGEGVRLINGIDGETYHLVGWARQANDGQLYYFFASAGGDVGVEKPLTLYRSAADGVTGQTPLRSDAHVIGEVLWSPDGSGAVINNATDFNRFPRTGPLLYLKADGSPAVELAGEGYRMKWGK